MDITIRVLQLITSMSLLIILHEMGHFLPAKWFKTKVNKFFLFFDPWFSIASWKKINGKWESKFFSKNLPDTEKIMVDGKEKEVPIDISKLPDNDWRKHPESVKYGIGWLPLGGYVSIAGMIDESNTDSEAMKKPAQDWEFRAKPAWQRLIIMIGGVTVNIILGFLIFIGVFAYWGTNTIPTENLKGKMYVSEKMNVFGFQDGDVPVAVNGKPIDNPLKVNRDLLLRNVDNITVVRADNSQKTIAVPDSVGMYIWKNGIREQAFGLKNPNTAIDSVVAGSPGQKAGLVKGDIIKKVNGTPVSSWNEFTEKVAFSKTKNVDLELERNGQIISKKTVLDDENKVGISVQVDPKLLDGLEVHKDLSFGESVKLGVSEAYNLVHDFVTQFKYVFTKKGATQMGGFGTISKLFGTSWDWHQFWVSTALISIMLGVMNLLPIPALDGGHILFLLYEMITGRKPNEKFLEYAQIFGMLLLFALMIYANGLDVLRALKN